MFCSSQPLPRPSFGADDQLQPLRPVLQLGALADVTGQSLVHLASKGRVLSKDVFGPDVDYPKAGACWMYHSSRSGTP